MWIDITMQLTRQQLPVVVVLLLAMILLTHETGVKNKYNSTSLLCANRCLF